jgi:hypothetical protein
MSDQIIPQVTANDVRELLDSPVSSPVLYVEHEANSRSGEPEIAVWDRNYVPADRVACTREEALEWLGEGRDDKSIAGLLPGLREDVDGIIAAS